MKSNATASTTRSATTQKLVWMESMWGEGAQRVGLRRQEFSRTTPSIRFATSSQRSEIDSSSS